MFAIASLGYASLVGLILGCTSRENPAPSPSASATTAASQASASAQPKADAPLRCAPKAAKRLSRASSKGGASSSVELARNGDATIAIVADEQTKAIHIVDTSTMTERGVTPLRGKPLHVLALENGLVAVSLRDTAEVVLLEPADDSLAKPFEERCKADVDVEPWALAEAKNKLFVTSGFGGALSILNENDLSRERLVRLPREPRAVLLDEAASKAFITHAVGGVVSAIDLADESKPLASISLLAGRRVNEKSEFDDKLPRQASQGYALARIVGKRGDGKEDILRIFAPHTSVDPGAPAMGVTIGYGGSGQGPRTMAPLVSVIDPASLQSITNHVASVFDDNFAPDCLLPRSAVADEQALFVACLDLGAVLELDPWVGDPNAVEHRRFSMPDGPSSLSLSADGKNLFVWSEFDRALSRIERESGAITSVRLWQRSAEKPDPKIERGKRLFHTTRDARVGMGRGCANCHPEGRDDGLLWTSPDGLRQTPMLSGRTPNTAPYGWFGEHATVRDHLNNTFVRLGGTGLEKNSEEDYEALLAYVASLPAPPKQKASEPDLVDRGKQVYAAYGCAGCHPGGGTDGKAHDVGSGKSGERRSEYDTPSLIGLRGSAPYYHDGRYSSLEELLSAPDQRMFSGTLQGADKKALLVFLETL